MPATVTWCLVDCVTGQPFMANSFPLSLGSPQTAPAPAGTLSQPPPGCVLYPADNSDRLFLTPGQTQVALNGETVTELQELVPGQDYALKVDNRLLAMRGGDQLEEWSRQLDVSRWYFFDSRTQLAEGPVGFSEVAAVAQQQQHDPRTTVVYPQGLGTGFYLYQFLEAQQPVPPPSVELPPAPLPPPESSDLREPSLAYQVKLDAGELTCPVCWLRFDKGDVMHIAVHDHLRGDPVLGEDASFRFHAVRFNNQGQALDAMGMPCSELACPHCRRRLPPGFLDMPHRIFSIVGAPSSGKSYFLCVLAKMLPATIYNRFGVTFRDADPAGNALLNEMKTQLFGTGSMEKAALLKTVLDGVMYERLPRFGRMVALPRPFVYNIASPKDSRLNFSLVFYDNAGEHFEPGRDSADSPGAQHVASASAIFFLFDPTVNTEFRRMLHGHHDPQLTLTERLDQQDTMLSEMEVRIKNLLTIDFRKKLTTPLAVIIGKCDVWLHLLGEEPLKDPLRGSHLDLAAIQANSQRIRALLKELCPALVANAETISTEVVYFAASAFGHSPEELADGRFGPDPKKIQPMFVEIPALWALTRTQPGLIPVTVGPS